MGTNSKVVRCLTVKEQTRQNEEEHQVRQKSVYNSSSFMRALVMLVSTHWKWREYFLGILDPGKNRRFNGKSHSLE